MPNLSGGKGKTSKGKKSSKQKVNNQQKSSRKKSGSKRPLDESMDEVVVAGVTPPEGDALEETVQMPAVKQAVSFSDGIVAPCIDGLVAIPRVGGQEVDLLRSFLRYFHITDTFIGNISSKTSFMKRKGGVLL